MLKVILTMFFENVHFDSKITKINFILIFSFGDPSFNLSLFQSILCKFEKDWLLVTCIIMRPVGRGFYFFLIGLDLNCLLFTSPQVN